MKEERFVLSEKKEEVLTNGYRSKDVKEFIQKIEDLIMDLTLSTHDKLQKLRGLAGEDLK